MEELKQHMKMYFTLNTGKLQDHRFSMSLPRIQSFLNSKPQGTELDGLPVAPPPHDYSSLLTEYIKPETMPSP